VKVDVEQNPASAARLNVRAVPNLVLLKEGRVVNQILGAVPKSRLVQAIDAALAG
jgi:thioredoxin 1